MVFRFEGLMRAYVPYIARTAHWRTGQCDKTLPNTMGWIWQGKTEPIQNSEIPIYTAFHVVETGKRPSLEQAKDPTGTDKCHMESVAVR
jgi:hypothetical protein